MQHASAYGLKAAGTIEADLDAVVKRSRGVAKQLNQGVTHLMKKNKITVHMGDGVDQIRQHADRHKGRQDARN
jgi:dihydrolipoamide dehydrogenase